MPITRTKEEKEKMEEEKEEDVIRTELSRVLKRIDPKIFPKKTRRALGYFLDGDSADEAFRGVVSIKSEEETKGKTMGMKTGKDVEGHDGDNGDNGESNKVRRTRGETEIGKVIHVHDALFHVVSFMNMKEIRMMCSTSKEMERILCNNRVFWRVWFSNTYGKRFDDLYPKDPPEGKGFMSMVSDILEQIQFDIGSYPDFFDYFRSKFFIKPIIASDGTSRMIKDLIAKREMRLRFLEEVQNHGNTIVTLERDLGKHDKRGEKVFRLSSMFYFYFSCFLSNLNIKMDVIGPQDYKYLLINEIWLSNCKDMNSNLRLNIPDGVIMDAYDYYTACMATKEYISITARSEFAQKALYGELQKYAMQLKENNQKIHQDGKPGGSRDVYNAISKSWLSRTGGVAESPDCYSMIRPVIGVSYTKSINRHVLFCNTMKEGLVDKKIVTKETARKALFSVFSLLSSYMPVNDLDIDDVLFGMNSIEEYFLNKFAEKIGIKPIVRVEGIEDEGGREGKSAYDVDFKDDESRLNAVAYDTEVLSLSMFDMKNLRRIVQELDKIAASNGKKYG